MSTPRRLLAAAAMTDSNGVEKVYALGGCGSACFLPPLQTSTFEATLVEIYDTRNNIWTTGTPMPVILFGAAAVAPGNGKIYTFGGVLSGNVVQQYDPQADKPGAEPWTLRSPMPTSHGGGLAAVAPGDGKIYVIGGSGPSKAVEAYDYVHDTWTVLAPMPTARVYLAAAALDGRIYALGGSPDCCGNSQTAAVEVYDPLANEWTAAAPLPIAMQLSGAAGVNGKIYVFGGFVPGTGAQAATFEYTPVPGAPGTWAARAPMPAPRDQAAAVLLDETTLAGQPIKVVNVVGGAIQCHCQALPGNDRYAPPSHQLSADLAITFDPAPETAASACQPVRYSIKVTNNGPDPAIGAKVEDIFPAALEDVSWTCSRFSPGAHCASSGAGPIEDLVDLPVDGSVTYTVSAALDPAASGTLPDTATVTPPPGESDSNLGNNKTKATARIAGCTIITISKTAESALAQPGGALGFTIVVTNHALTGIDVTLTDNLVGGLTDATWCLVGECPELRPFPTDTANVPAAGGTVTYRLSGIVPCGATKITNTACAVGPDGISHCAGASVPVGPSCADLEVQNLAPDAVTAGTAAVYRMVAINHGPCPADRVALSPTLPACFALKSGPGPCEESRFGISCPLGHLAPDGTPHPVELTVTVACNCAAGPTTSTGVVSGSTCDLKPGNNMASRPTRVDVQADYAITKEAVLRLPPVSPLELSVYYTLQATNLGPSCPCGVAIADIFGPHLLSPYWCRGTGCPPMNPGNLVDTLCLQKGMTETFQAIAGVDAAFSGELCNTASVSVPPPAMDTDLGNNTATACVSVSPPPSPPPSAPPSMPPVPTLSRAALALLALLLPALAVARLRRRAGRRRG